MTKGERSAPRRAPLTPHDAAVITALIRELQAQRDLMQRLLDQRETRSPDHEHDATGLEHRGG